jgi:hypothetical protein
MMSAWHIADIPPALTNVRYRVGKADMARTLDNVR